MDSFIEVTGAMIFDIEKQTDLDIDESYTIVILKNIMY